MLDSRPIKSPCVSICVMDPATGWCEGCYRTLAEIGGWARFSPEERDRVMRTLLPVRRQAARVAGPRREHAE
jgi:predicted Fe-S protein YdhL (DUF1289 family)